MLAIAHKPNYCETYCMHASKMLSRAMIGSGDLWESGRALRAGSNCAALRSGRDVIHS